jgi:hypothetical protein
MEITLEKAFLHGAHVLFEATILQISPSFILFQKGFHLSNVRSVISLKKKWLFLKFTIDFLRNEILCLPCQP